ncbi:MAG: hypothetical protein KC561_15905, partial [Myxococcales bacterium]|nr:hypothetical protein [Myxococcales bacterium]
DSNKLNHMSDLIAEAAARLRETRDRIGLITFDWCVYGHIKTQAAKSTYQPIINHLTGLRTILEPGFTEGDELDVVGRLVRFLMVQERLDFRVQGSARDPLAPRESLYDLPLLDHWLGRQLPLLEEELSCDALASGVLPDHTLTLVRRYAQLVGVEVPYRMETRFGSKELGLVDAIERFLKGTRESHLLLLVSDLCGIVNTREVLSALKLALSRKHKIIVLLPYTPDYAAPIESTQGGGHSFLGYNRSRATTEVFRMAERRERERIIKAVRALGVQVIPVGPGQTLDEALGNRRATPRTGHPQNTNQLGAGSEPRERIPEILISERA